MRSSYRTFVLGFCLLAPLFAFTIIFFNFFIDPFELYETPKIPGINQVKSEIETQNRLVRAMDIARQKPKALLLGTSRVMGGFDPQDLTAITHETSYNAGLSGASFDEIYRLFEHALYHQPDLKVVILGLDLFAFSSHKKLEDDLKPERLQYFPSLPWKDIYTSLFTKESLLGSYQTLQKNLTGKAIPVFFSNGQYNPFLFDSENNPLFVKGDLDFVKRMFSSSILYRSFELDTHKLELFAQLVKTCQERSIELKCFICPCKAIYWEALYRKGLWPVLTKLKTELSTIHPIWDFSGYNPVTTQAIEDKICRFYFECSHFTPDLGKYILNQIFSQPKTIEGFGNLLTPQTLSASLAKIEKERLHWIKKQETLVQAIDEALKLIQ